MATREEVMTTLGVDASAMEQGLGIGRSYMSKWVSNVQEQERGYTGWWNQELKKREEMEIAASVNAARRSIQARKLLRARETEQQAAQQAKNVIIGQGSIPAGWAEQAAAKKAAIELEKKAAEGLKEVGSSAHFGAGAMREVMVLMREGLRGNFRAMIGSSSRLLSLMGIANSSLAGLGAAAAEAGAIIYFALSSRKAQQGYDNSLNKEKQVDNKLAGHLRQDIQNMLEAGKISKVVADKYLAILAHPTIGRVTEVAKLLQPIGSVGKKDASEIHRLEEEHLKKLVEYQRENEDITIRHASDTLRVVGLKHDMAALDKHSLEYAQKQIELDEAQHELDEDNKKMALDKLDLQRRLNDEQKIYRQTQLRISEMEQHEREKFMPTLDELAKHGGAGGHASRQIERLERRIKRDFFHGDTNKAGTDIASRNKLYDSLASRGLVAERSEMRELNKINAEAALSLKRIAEGTAVIKARIAMG